MGKDKTKENAPDALTASMEFSAEVVPNNLLDSADTPCDVGIEYTFERVNRHIAYLALVSRLWR